MKKVLIVLFTFSVLGLSTTVMAEGWILWEEKTQYYSYSDNRPTTWEFLHGFETKTECERAAKEYSGIQIESWKKRIGGTAHIGRFYNWKLSSVWDSSPLPSYSLFYLNDNMDLVIIKHYFQCFPSAFDPRK